MSAGCGSRPDPLLWYVALRAPAKNGALQQRSRNVASKRSRIHVVHASSEIYRNCLRAECTCFPLYWQRRSDKVVESEAYRFGDGLGHHFSVGARHVSGFKSRSDLTSILWPDLNQPCQQKGFLEFIGTPVRSKGTLAEHFFCFLRSVKFR